ncbi:hypothetical protein CEXT_807141 [Caerostris extrusa]|uniref:Uncharacterized protein n=1 Tax=Caerostris extrusa TaxID=172846 RepID=A0AAV4QUI0_CAEEX|nr:hypothetical protein CEXT_807141 [Caerostris extrusa]
MGAIIAAQNLHVPCAEVPHFKKSIFVVCMIPHLYQQWKARSPCLMERLFRVSQDFTQAFRWYWFTTQKTLQQQSCRRAHQKSTTHSQAKLIHTPPGKYPF